MCCHQSEAFLRIAQLERALEASERRMRNIINRTADGILVLDGEGTILFANRAAAELFGDHESLVGTNFGFPLLAGESAEIDVRSPDAQLRTVELRTAATEWEGEIATVAALRDVTERRQAETAVRESERRYRQVFEEAFTANFVSSPDGRLLACNSAFLRIFGFANHEEALQSDAASLYPDPAAREAFLDLVRKRRQLDAYELELRRTDGTPVFVVENVFGAFDERGELRTITGFVLDVTEQRNLEQQLRQAQKMEAVGRLAGGVAHDFNNLLTVIRGYTSLILDELDAAEPVHANLREVLRAAERACALTTRLLAFSRRQIAEPKNFDINDLLRDMRGLLRAAVGPSIRLSILAGEDLGAVCSDPSQFEQAIMNLVVNARDAMPGGGELSIETANVTLDDAAAARLGLQAGPYVTLAVSDSGHGMDKDVLRHLFEPFFTTKAKGKGTGLGLSIVYGIVKQSGGEIIVQSQPGQGTTFRLYLPRACGRPEPAGGEISPAPPATGSETVLLVEDEDKVRALVRAILLRAGYRVLEAAAPLEALRLCRQHEFQLMLTDVMMPEMNGRDLADAVLAIRPGVPVLFMSGYTESAILNRGTLSPGAEFIAKPFSPDALNRKVRELLDRAG